MDLAKYAAKYDPAEAFRQLTDPDPAVRLVGAKWVAKQAHGEVNRFTEGWLKNASTMDRLLPKLSDPDPLVAEFAVGAANVIVARYRSDDRTIPATVQLLGSDRPGTRLRAVMLLTQFDDEQLAEPLLSMFNDPDKRVRTAVVSEIARPSRGWSPGIQELLRQAALERLGDRAMDVRCSAAGLLISVGKPEDLAALKQGLKGIKGHNYRQDYRESVSLFTERLRSAG